MRNIATTHLLDAVAANFGQKCHEVPVGFKHISGKMTETNAIIGGESSGGLTVQGHINGKDGIYAAMLLIEMLAVSGRKLSEIYTEITDAFGQFVMVEHDCEFSAADREKIHALLMIEQRLPNFPVAIKRTSYLDGCKVYFDNGGWIIVRFSGTESLLRIFCEMPTYELAQDCCNIMRRFLGIS